MGLNRMLRVGAMTIAMLASTASYGATTLIFGEPGPNRGARAQATQWFADEVGRLTGGDLKIDIHWGGALYSERAAVRSVRDGVADIGTVIAILAPRELISYAFADLPLENPDAWVGMRATDDLMRNNVQIAGSLADENLIYVGTYTTSGVQIGCTGDPVRTIDDIKGKKLRGVGAYGKTFADLGATLVDISVYEAYQGLENGLIDCTQTYTYLIEALKFGEVLDNYTSLGWGQIDALGIMVNKDAFDALSADHQNALMRAGKGLADEFGRSLNEVNEASKQLLKDRGTPIYTLPQSDRARLVKAGQKYVDDWIVRANEAGLDGAAILAQYRDLIDKYTQEVADHGYPWTR